MLDAQDPQVRRLLDEDAEIRATRPHWGHPSHSDRYALIHPADGVPAVQDCTFRMLAPTEIAAGMAFAADHRVTGTTRPAPANTPPEAAGPRPTPERIDRDRGP